MRAAQPAVTIDDLSRDSRFRGRHLRLRFKLFVYLCAGLLAHGSIDVIAPADVVRSRVECDSATRTGSTFRSKHLDVGASDAAAMAVTLFRAPADPISAIGAGLPPAGGLSRWF